MVYCVIETEKITSVAICALKTAHNYSHIRTALSMQMMATFWKYVTVMMALCSTSILLHRSSILAQGTTSFANVEQDVIVYICLQIMAILSVVTATL